MSIDSIVIMPDLMKAIARYEATFDQFMGEDEIDEGRILFPEKYQITLQDLCLAIQNMLIKNPTVQEFGDNWYFPLMEVEDAFGIPKACGSSSEDDSPYAQPEVRGLPLTDEDVFSAVWNYLEETWTMEDEETHLSELDQLKTLVQDIETFLANKEKPLMEKDFTDHQKKAFIRSFEYNNRVKTATETELMLCRRFTEELCEKGSETALRLKGYACYGGNRLYDCDWAASRDCMIRLFEKTDDPGYADTLGYIYYYGRCTGGVPEYEKAFEMFSIAAANGLHEGLYKLADMFRHGYACKKSYRTARALYGMTYEDCYKKFLEGAEGGSFADAALRMGNAYLKGIGEAQDPVAAYHYYLQADYAARLRAGNSDFFGNTTVAINIQKALDETKEVLPKDFFKEYLSLVAPWVFWSMVEDGYRGNVSLIRQEDGSTKVVIARRPRNKRQDAEPILLTCPELNYCDLITEIELTGSGIRTSFEDPEPAFKYDFVEWNETENRIDFYYDEEFAGWIACEEYRLYAPKQEAPSGQLLTLVSVSFQPGGRTYDYLCEISNVQVGDKVIVMGYDGETEVKVQAVYNRYESELGLPMERYKKVVRRAE